MGGTSPPTPPLALTLRLLQIKSAHTIPTIPTTDITITAIVPPLIFSFFVVVLLLLLRIGAVTFPAASGIEILCVPVFSVVTAALADGCGCIELFAEDPAIDEALLLLLLLLVVVVLLLVVVVVVVVVVGSAVRVPVSVVVVVVVVVVVAVVHGFCCRVSVVNAGFFRNLQGQPSAPLLPSLMHCSISVRIGASLCTSARGFAAPVCPTMVRILGLRFGASDQFNRRDCDFLPRACVNETQALSLDGNS